MSHNDYLTLRTQALELRRRELGRIVRAAGIEWSTLIRRIRASLSRTPPCPEPARNPRHA